MTTHAPYVQIGIQYNIFLYTVVNRLTFLLTQCGGLMIFTTQSYNFPTYKFYSTLLKAPFFHNYRTPIKADYGY